MIDEFRYRGFPFLGLLDARLDFRDPASLASSRQRPATLWNICFAVSSLQLLAKPSATCARLR